MVVIVERAPSRVWKWAQNTAWILDFDFQAVFSGSGRRLTSGNGRKTPPRSQILIFRRCFQAAGAISRLEMGAKHRLNLSFYFSGGVSSERETSEWVRNSNS